ncbi:hypothetical protein BBJ28_00012872 [Nothophytophthora sp. Chile5]|nr:hypothetical protein BBJ28_00012872 [Nothophytophthora sp. Chile5]
MNAHFPNMLSSSQPLALAMSQGCVPGDLLASILSFLTGFDAFALSHTSSQWLRNLSNEEFWQKRLQGESTGAQEHQTASNKQRYMQTRSTLFGELCNARFRGPYAFLERISDVETGLYGLGGLQPDSFSFDVWFSLLPTTDCANKWVGGVLYGLQCGGKGSGRYLHVHQQFVEVDSNCNLYCSVLDAKKVVASDLAFNRWYHLALTYDYDLKQQDVYVNGENVWSETGGLNHDWSQLLGEQIGTGWVTNSNDYHSRRGFSHWYDFQGVIDDFRVWRGALSSPDVDELARGGSLSRQRLQAAMRPPGSNTAVHPRDAKSVRCTRPAEGKGVQMLKL